VNGFPLTPSAFSLHQTLWLVASGCLAIQSREVSRNDDTGLASIDRRIRSHIAADHDIDQPDIGQI
jgi:hypothetical protein